MQASRDALGMGSASGVGGREKPGPAHFVNRGLRSSCSDGDAGKVCAAVAGLGRPLCSVGAPAADRHTTSNQLKVGDTEQTSGHARAMIEEASLDNKQMA